MSRPLKIVSSNILREMSDNDLDYINYRLREIYANKLNDGTITSGQLRIGTASGYTSIGSAVNTITAISTASQARTNNSGDDVDPDGAGPTEAGDWPSAPSLTENTNTTTYFQDQLAGGIPTYPANSVLDDDSFLLYSGNALRVAGATEAQLYDDIVSQCIADMKTGDEVGTYRVSTSTPTDGGAGTWIDKGTWFSDTTYDQGTTTYKYWLKTRLTTRPSYSIEPLRWTGSQVREMDSDQLDNLCTNVLLPVLRRRLDDGDLNYTVGTSIGADINRGSFVDKKQTGSTASYAFTDPTYYTYSTPSGAASDVNTYYLLLGS